MIALSTALLCVLSAELDAVDEPRGPTARVETSVASPVSTAQAKYFGPGLALGVGIGARLSNVFELSGRVGWTWLSPRASTAHGESFLAGASGRAWWPDADALLRPWAEVDAALAMTSGARVALGGALGIVPRWRPLGHLAVGAEVRLTHIFKTVSNPAFDSEDATLLTAGLTLSWAFGDPAPRRLAAVSVDSDGDGIPDASDACPEVAEDLDGHDDADGCPDVDDDHDGLADAEDRCPEERGPRTNQGCPDHDTDGDGVADSVDSCPRVKGTDADGCPSYRTIVVSAQHIELQQKIFFAFGLTTILPRSFPLLDEVATALADREHACVRVEGHTDSAGNADANLKLSEGRAAAVVTYLTSRGIAGGRLEAKGFGSQLPRDNNSTAEGRDNNRRVEFTLIPCNPLNNARSSR